MKSCKTTCIEGTVSQRARRCGLISGEKCSTSEQDTSTSVETETSLIRSMLHDESFFPNPHSFEPERYLGYEEKTPLTSTSTLRSMRLKPPQRFADPSFLAFGFGRRICPGMHLADDGIFIAIASTLAVFDILKARDERGNEIIPEVDYVGFLR